MKENIEIILPLGLDLDWGSEGGSKIWISLLSDTSFIFNFSNSSIKPVIIFSISLLSLPNFSNSIVK